MSETPDWRAQRWAATHQRLYDTALELFQSEGFDAVNVGRIAREAGVSVPTFYAHYPSKEHLVMRMPSAAEFAEVLSATPATAPLAARFRQAVVLWMAQWSPEDWQDAMIRWRIIAKTPSLRTRAAEFERATGHVLADSMPPEPGAKSRPSDLIVINAYMVGFTAALLAWADCGGERKLEELMEESFDALESR